MLVSMRAPLLLLAVLLASAQVLPAQGQAVDPDILLRRAITEQQQGDYVSAIRDYREYLTLRPDAVQGEVNLGAALAHIGQYDEAISLYRKALPSLSYKNPVLLNLGLAYYKKGDFSNAHQQFQELQKLDPHNVKIAVLLGDSDLKLGNSQDAVDLLQPLAGEGSNNLDFQYVLGTALIRTGHLRDGVAYIEEVAHKSDSADSYQLAGATLLQLNEYERARHDLETALRLDPKLPNIYTLVGEARDKSGATDLAEAAFLKALQSNPDDFEANLYVGAILYKRRDTEKAKAYLEKALKLRPTDPMARYESAMLKSATGQYEAATLDLEQLVKDDPQWLEPHVELASLYYKLHRPQDGAKERAIVDRITEEQQTRGPGK
jgi:tetratricopeptide (TPR) repeat protein